MQYRPVIMDGHVSMFEVTQRPSAFDQRKLLQDHIMVVINRIQDDEIINTLKDSAVS
jgi:hypothetical protein